MSRRRTAAPAAFLLLVLACSPPAEPPPAEVSIPRGPRPLVVVTLDTTRPDHLQPYGADHVATPALLRLAREGVLFEQAMAVAPITLVAHTSLFTGLYPPRHGVRNNGIHQASGELETLAERLQGAGYRTAAFVSAAVLEKRYGLHQGFDHYDDDLSTGTDRHPRVVPDRPAAATVDAALTWLDGLGETGDDGEARAAAPFFVWVHFYDPHAVYSPPAPYRDRYRDDLYSGEIAYMDAELGRLLAHPALTEAAVAVVGDHGESLGEHGEQTHAILAYQSTLHIPWLMSIPGGPKGLRVDRPISQVDLVPTLLDLLGLASAPDLQGHSLLPWIEGRGDAAPDPLHYAETYLPFYTYGWAKLRVARRSAWKWIDGPEPELYHLGRDPDEGKDLRDDEAEVAQGLALDLEALLGDDGDAEQPLALDSEAADRLRSLGYLAAGTRPREGPRPNPRRVIDLHVGLEQARALLRDRRARDAEQTLRQVLDRDPGNLSALVELAAARELQGDLDGAVAAVDRALALDPDYTHLYVLMARLEQRRDRLAQAVDLLDAALALEPRHLEARLQKATALVRLGRPRAAREVLEAARRDEGDHPRLLAVMARLLDDGPELTEKRLREALQKDPYLVLAWRLLGRHLEKIGRTSEAVQAYRQGLARAPDDVELHARLGQLLASTGEDAEAHLREALRLSLEPRPDVEVTLGAHLADRGRLTEALAIYDRVLEEHPAHLGARNNRAVALYRLGKNAEARGLLERLAKEQPSHADAHNNLAAMELDGRHWREAETHARRALAADPALANAWLNLGLAQAGQGEANEAEASLRRAAELAPGLWPARFHLGRLLLEGARPAEGLDLLRRLVSEVPSFPDVHLLLGEHYATPPGDPRRARGHLNAFLRLVPPEDPRVGPVRRRLTDLTLAAP